MASIKLQGQVWNHDFRAVVPIADLDPPWWNENINSELFSNDIELCQESPIALEIVHHEPPGEFGVGPDSLSAVFQPASYPSGFSQQSPDVNVPANSDIDLELEALLAFPDGSNYTVFQDPTFPHHSDWDSVPLSSFTPQSDCDLFSPISTVSTSAEDENRFHESHQNCKSQISALPSFRCPRCSALFSSEQRVGYVAAQLYAWMFIDNDRSHIQTSHRHASKCNGCGKRFTIPKDLRRHLQTSASCRKGSAPLFACKCGATFVRKDHLLRHIRRKTEERKDVNHLPVEIGLSN